MTASDALGAALAAYLLSGPGAFDGWTGERMHNLRVGLDRHLAGLASEATARLWVETVVPAGVSGHEVLDDLHAEPLGWLHGLSGLLGERAGRPGWLHAGVWGDLGVDHDLSERLNSECWRQASALRADTAWAEWWEAVAPVPECHVVLGAVLAATTPDGENDFFEEGVVRKRGLVLVVRQVSAKDLADLDDEARARALAVALVSCIEAAAAKGKGAQAHPPVPQALTQTPGSHGP